MGKGRLEAFSDGVIAILITIMVLELKVPHGEVWEDLLPLVPTVLSYLLSFVFLGIYWSNHHHLVHTVRRVDGPLLWANLHLLFWLSLVPFTTNWLGDNPLAPVPVMLYGINLFLAGFAYWVVQLRILRTHKPDSPLHRAVARFGKGNLSLALYAAAIVLALWLPVVSQGLYVTVALVWLVPDRRIEEALARPEA